MNALRDGSLDIEDLKLLLCSDVTNWPSEITLGGLEKKQKKVEKT